MRHCWWFFSLFHASFGLGIQSDTIWRIFWCADDFWRNFQKKTRQITACNIFTLQLQVLDLGFNLIRVIPTTAFKETKDLTLLALDGNPMAFIPEEAISHLNKSLRGLSLGGRFLTCDCKMRWITEWIQNFDLQVTSRERNPQFCGNPQHLRDRNFYQLNTRGMYLCCLMIGIVTDYGRMIANGQFLFAAQTQLEIHLKCIKILVIMVD